jgi:hypothetical protein
MNWLKRLARRLVEEAEVGRSRFENHVRPFAPVSIVTAADSKYFVPMKRLLGSVHQHEQGVAARIVVFDMGLSSAQTAFLANRFPLVRVEKFDVSSEIPWATIAANAGFYAWKPIMINRVMRQFGDDVIWLDASIVVRRPLWRIRSVMRSRGFYGSYWTGRAVKDATSPVTISVLNAKAESELPMIVASAVGFSARDSKATAMLSEWVRQATDPAVNNPPGATVGTHKGDQSVLSILAYRFGIVEPLPKRLDSWRLDYFIQNDRKTMFLDTDSD